ncbi:uncharacterized protein C8Q71DRAFT_911985 [Rhodofomes roseus]|uniref:Fungal-type protein kinase domain-containing protein n=1 Tax=Rhodofomes roseus TaxID=34475 RepID=A0ABQ8JY11_9APHY|nr:uncharacterized protein C8Q71DRAFT_911985 [Rhodofomes roseus]KAH9829141.1 hypothetical protein C8Q71DRAFT_911985 [Rhodofomes roseus]
MAKVVRRRLEETKPDYRKHTMDFKWSITKSAEEMPLPQFAPRLGVDPEADNLRVRRWLVLREYEPLETIGTADNFRVVFFDVVRAHHWVYKTSKILHRNVSLNNLMWHRLDGRIVGVLCDWDLAEDQNTAESKLIRRAGDNSEVVWRISEPTGRSATKSTAASSTSLLAVPEDQAAGPPPSGHWQLSGTATKPQGTDKSRYRIGTGAFMAMDLLRVGEPPVHKYRHDLELFFYAYIYFAATYNPDEQAFGYIKDWQCASLVAIGDNKRRFLEEESIRRDVMKAAHDTLKPLLDEDSPLADLLDVFLDLETKAHYIRSLRSTAKKASRNQAEIERREGGRDETITYGNFMRILGAPEVVNA